ncbi:MAG: glycosyltransferase family 1 protein [Nitrospiraceae bacterium]|nr:glycosyltransferase family 1 protein [Nitrospiraceae bacterium]
MNIAVDAFALTEKQASGIPNYTRKLLSPLAGLNRADKYFLYSRDPFEFEQGPNIIRRALEKKGGLSYGNTLWLFSRGIQLMQKDKIDIFWGPRHMLPPILPKKIKKVLTVHDLAWKYYPETLEKYNLLIMKLFAERSIRRADHILAVSGATARGLMALGVPEERITVTYNAADGFKPLDKSSSAEYICRKYGTNKNYVLTVSTVEPRKNLVTLLRAFAPLRGPQLVIAGARGWKNAAVHAEYEKLGFREEEVKFLGYVPDEEMNMLYSGAMVFVFPSIYEGFGMPLLEAMASGAPVISSNTSSLPEVAGDAGILLPPLDVEKWSAAISKALGDKTLRKEMISKGLSQSKKFSWEDSARKTLRVFQGLVNS